MENFLYDDYKFKLELMNSIRNRTISALISYSI